MTSRERLRASDADRERAVAFLHDAATEGRLDADELDERVARAFAATTYGELDTLVEDLPMPVRTPAPPATRPVRAGWWPRLGAFVLDGLLVGLIAGLLSAAFDVHAEFGWLAVAISAVYFTAMEGGPSAGGVGKRAVGLRVVDRRTGATIGYPRAFARWLAHFVSWLAFFIGYLWMLGDSERQCWHDKFAGDVVVYGDGRQELEPQRRLV